MNVAILNGETPPIFMCMLSQPQPLYPFQKLAAIVWLKHVAFSEVAGIAIISFEGGSDQLHLTIVCAEYTHSFKIFSTFYLQANYSASGGGEKLQSRFNLQCELFR